MVQRRRPKWQPTFDGVVRNWTLKYISKNYWRVIGRYEIEDLLQECYVLFLMCKEKYPYVSSPQHFMSLYMKIVNNHFHKMAKEIYTERDTISTMLQEQDCDKVDHNMGELIVFLERCSSPTKKFIKTLCNNCEVFQTPYKKKPTSALDINGNRLYIRETKKEYIIRVLGLNNMEDDLHMELQQLME